MTRSKKAKETVGDLEKRVTETMAGMRGWIDDNSRLVIFGALGIGILQWAGYINLGIPDWWPLGIGIIVSAAGAAYVGADKVAGLIPSEDGILLIALDEQNEVGRGIYEISEDDWADLSVDGTLEQWDESHRRVYECVHYSEEENHAVANWRESAPSSELLSKETVPDALEKISELRETIEPEAAKARKLQRQIHGLVRVLDRERAAEMDRAIANSTVDADMDDATISNIVDEFLADDLHPHAGGGKEPTETKTNGHTETVDRIDIETDEFDAILDEDEPTPRGL